MEEQIWLSRQRSRVLWEGLRSLLAFWRDQASRDIGLRYLRPFEEDDTKMLASFGEQFSYIQSTEQHLATADQHARDVEDHVKSVQGHLVHAQEESQQAREYEDDARTETSSVIESMSEISRLIQSANSAC